MRIWRHPLLGSAGGPLRIGVPSELFCSNLLKFFGVILRLFHSVPLKHLNSIPTMLRDSILMGILKNGLLKYTPSILSSLILSRILLLS